MLSSAAQTSWSWRKVCINMSTWPVPQKHPQSPGNIVMLCNKAWVRENMKNMRKSNTANGFRRVPVPVANRSNVPGCNEKMISIPYLEVIYLSSMNSFAQAHQPAWAKAKRTTSRPCVWNIRSMYGFQRDSPFPLNSSPRLKRCKTLSNQAFGKCDHARQCPKDAKRQR